MLANVRVEIQKRDQRRVHVERAVGEAETELQKLLDVNADEGTKQAYFKLRADMQASNAEAERERSVLVAYAQETLVQKK